MHLVLNRQQRMFHMGSWEMEKASIFENRNLGWVGGSAQFGNKIEILKHL